ncbi:hypothetical protein ACJMK2_006978 [Sinanodonta woodiana]|uniref:Hemicentin-1-like n=1 Tax=Sinanodonta woodiana TaxID=1069815 RepID=A0ABD3VH03_SINWO
MEKADIKRNIYLALVALIFCTQKGTGTPYVSIVGGDAYLNWTINNLIDDVPRFIRNPSNTASLLIFSSGEPFPAVIDNRATFTGDIQQGIVSFTLSNVKLSDAGKYTFTKINGNATLILGGQVLIVAVSPDIPVIKSLSEAAVVEKEHTLNCSTESRSVPLNHSLTMHSFWKHNGVNISLESGYIVSSTLLTIINLTRKDNGDQFTCQAFEDQRRLSTESIAFFLNVLYGPDNAQVNPSGILNVTEGGNMNLTCTAECNPPCSTYHWSKDSLQTIVGSSQSYWVPEVRRNQSGIYSCTVTNTNISRIATSQIIVSVNYGPDDGSITVSTNQTLESVEFSPLSVNCSAVCYPSCQYRWTGPGNYSYGNTGMLSIPQIMRNQTGVFTCTATNPEIINKSATATISVNVLYGPDDGSTTLTPNQTLESVEYSPLSVSCSADCYPFCHYRWTGPGNYSYGNTGVLFIPQIKRDQTGVFTCTAINPRRTNGSATANLSVTVFYGPDNPMQLMPVNTSYRLREGATLIDINCTCSCFPVCKFHWTGPVPSLTGVISLGKVNRSVRGNYTCIGRNPRTQNWTTSTVVTIIVIFGPDTPVLSPNTNEYTLNEDNIIPNIKCSSECFPGCTFYWYKEQTKLLDIKEDVLALGNVYRNGSGRYTCKSENIESLAIGTKDIQLVVQYPPTVSIVSQNGSFSETGITINCSAYGIPERYNYSLIHSALFSESIIQHVIENEPRSTGVLVYSFMNPSFMDTGLYTCSVRNGIPDYRDGSLDQNVSVPVWIKGPPNVTSNDTDFYAKKGDSGRLVVEFYNSLLDASVTWNKQENQIQEKLQSSNKYNISVAERNVTVKFYKVFVQQPGFITTLEIKNVTEEDFVTYQVLLQNSAGNISHSSLSLRPRGRPDIPRDVQIITNRITTTSVDIEWLSGFHGGSNQTFVIEYRKQVDKSWSNYSRNVFGGLMQNKYFNIIIEDLHQNTLYFFQLYAWNEFGRSEYSTTINATTFAESNKQDVIDKGPDEVIIGIAVGVVVFLSVIVAVVGIILYKRRRDKKTHKDGMPLEPDAR